MNAQKETKNIMFLNEARSALQINSYNNQSLLECYTVMPDIINVRVIKDENGAERAVSMTFADGTSTKAVAAIGDTFSLEMGISICITQRLIQQRVGARHYKAVYNKLIKYALKVKKKREETTQRMILQETHRQAKAQKLAAKKQRRKARIEAEKREYEIELRKEAYLRAMRELEGEGR